MVGESIMNNVETITILRQMITIHRRMIKIQRER